MQAVFAVLSAGLAVIGLHTSAINWNNQIDALWIPLIVIYHIFSAVAFFGILLSVDTKLLHLLFKNYKCVRENERGERVVRLFG
jgi:hypothetical protein